MGKKNRKRIEAILNQNSSINIVQQDEEAARTSAARIITPRIWAEFAAAFSAGLAAFSTGAAFAWPVTISKSLQKGETFLDFKMNEQNLAWISALPNLGAAVMALATGSLCDMYGRKKMMLLVMLPIFAGWAVLILSKNIAMAYIGRFLMGFTIGGVSVAMNLYTSEIASDSLRGVLGVLYQLFLIFGIFMSYWTGYSLNSVFHTVICVMPAIMFMILFAVQPETPLYILKKGEEQKAEQTLKKFRGSKYNVRGEFDQMKEYVEHVSRKYIFYEILVGSHGRKSMFIVVGLMFFQQMSGVKTVINYTSAIFGSVGMDERMNADHINIVIVGVHIIGVFVCAAIVDRVGRKPLLLISCIGTFVALLIVAIFHTFVTRHIMSSNDQKQFGYGAMFAIFLYVMSYSLGLGPIPWLMAPEVPPPEVKATLFSIAASINWTIAFLVSMCYLEVIKLTGLDIPYYIYAISTLAGVVFVITVVVETKNKSFKEISNVLS